MNKHGESISIQNQKLILTSYVLKQGWEIYDVYEDDGWSGTNFNRPEVKRLLKDVDLGFVNLVIVKDLSRFGRNYIQIGQYLDYYFPSKNVRFIALNDNVDTIDRDINNFDMAPIINLFNEWHSANISKKLRVTLISRAKLGYYYHNPPYGYKKGKDQKGTFEIDEEAAKVIRVIFKLRAEGHPFRYICNILNMHKIPTPLTYFYQKENRKCHFVHDKYWKSDTARRITLDETYIGTLCRLTTVKPSYKSNKKIEKKQTDWLKFKDSHPKIIDLETWEKVQEVNKSHTFVRGHPKQNLPLQGLLYCKDCGKRMKIAYNNNRGPNNTRRYHRENYNCGSYVSYGRMSCTSHHIKVVDLSEFVLKDIKRKARQVKRNPRKFIEECTKIAEKNYSSTINDTDKKIKDFINRQNEIEKIIKKLYEDKVNNIYTEEEANAMISSYFKEEKMIKRILVEITSYSKTLKYAISSIDDLMNRFLTYSSSTELTKDMCKNLIEYVTIDKYTPNIPLKKRKIKIYYKYITPKLENKLSLFGRYDVEI